MAVINTMEDLIRLLDEKPKWVEALRVRLLTRELIELPEKFAEFVKVTNERFDGIESQVQSLRDDVGMLKGAHARSAAIREASSIAREMNLSRTKNLSQDDLWALIDRADTVGIPNNVLRSFRRADLIMEATDRDGETCYIAVEISFTVNGRDTTRALRNAEFLTRFTGKPAHAAVVGLRRDDRVHDLIKRGDVFWYQLDAEIYGCGMSHQYRQRSS